MNELVEKETYGPAMAACSPRERLFVEFVCDDKPYAAAARLAGYGAKDGTSTPGTFARIAYRIIRYDRVVAAIAEVCKSQIRSAAPEAVRALREILSDVSHKDRFGAVKLIANRIDPEVSKVDVSVEHKFDPLKTTLEYVKHLKELGTPRDILIREFGKGGLDYYESLLAKEAPIEGDFVELPAPDTAETAAEDWEAINDGDENE